VLLVTLAAGEPLLFVRAYDTLGWRALLRLPVLVRLVTFLSPKRFAVTHMEVKRHGRKMNIYTFRW